MTAFFHWALSSRFIHVVARISTSFLYIAKNILLYTVSYLFINILFIHSSVNEHFGFHILATVNMCMSFGADVCFHLSWLHTKEWHWWAIWWLCLTFSGSARLFPKVTAQFCILTSSVTSIPISSQPHQHLLSFLL